VDVWHYVWQNDRMEKTTVYLPSSLVQRVKAVASRKSVSEASVIRSAIEHYTDSVERPRPRVALYETGRPIADWDEALRGFGER
jgi:predicted transcriptional regulator